MSRFIGIDLALEGFYLLGILASVCRDLNVDLSMPSDEACLHPTIITCVSLKSDQMLRPVFSCEFSMRSSGQIQGLRILKVHQLTRTFCRAHMFKLQSTLSERGSAYQ